MKKFFSHLLLLSIISFTVMTSCSKTEVQDQMYSNSELNDARGGHHGGNHHDHHNGGCHNPNCHNPNCHNPHCNVPPTCPPPGNPCPTAVATVSDFTYDLDFVTTPGLAGITGTISYTNEGPDGTFSIQLRDANNLVDTTWISDALHTDAGQVNTIQFVRYVDNNIFPYFLTLEGRPADLQCTIRSNTEVELQGSSRNAILTSH